MGSQYHANLIGFEEFFNSCYAEFGDVVDTHGISRNIRSNLLSWLILCVHWIAPKKVNEELLFRSRDLSKADRDRSLNLLNIFDLVNGGANTSMDAQNLILCVFISNDSSKR
jgi:hypothetical protein